MTERVIARGRRRARLLAVTGAVFVAEIVWAVAEFAFGIQLQAPAGNTPTDLGPGFVAVTATVLSLAAWAVLAGLERLTAHARGVWLLLAPLALLASLSMPLSGTGVSAANRAALVAMHIAAAAMLIPTFYRTSPRRTPERRENAKPFATGATM